MSEEREQRNQVFTPAAPPHQAAPSPPLTVDPRIAAATAVDRVKAEFGLDIPVELAPIPSGGKAYPHGHPLHGKDRVEIRSMTAREEDILTSRALLKKGTVITELIKSCLNDKTIDPSTLLTGDRNALMVSIRVTGYGADYDAEVECSECNVKSNQTFNLAGLELQPLDIEPTSPGENLFEFRLPVCKKNVKFKFMTGLDEQEMMATQAQQKKLGLSTDSAVTTGLKSSIVSIDGQDDRPKINSFINMMPARDSLALRNYIRDNEPGIKMKQNVECPACGATAEVGMPIGTSFLWPAAGR